MEEIILISEKDFYPDSNYKDINEFLSGYSKDIINVKDVLNKHPTLQKVTLKNLSRDVAESLIIIDVDCPNIKVELKDCDFTSIRIHNTSIKELNIQGSYKEIEKNEFNPIGFQISQNSKIETVWISKTQNFGKINIHGKNTQIDTLGLIFLKNLKEVFVNAEINSFKFYNGNSLENDGFLANQIDSINLMESRIENLELSSIRYSNFYTGAESFMFQNESDYQGQSASINNIKILNSTFPLNFKLTSNLINLESVFFEKCTFKSLAINHEKANIKIDDCTIDEKLTIGKESIKAISSKFEITNNTVGKGISFGKHHIKEEFKIEGNRLQNGRWEFNGFSLDENCKSEITNQSFKDATFQNCNFSNFDFQDTDIYLAEIIEPTWNEVDIANQKRIQFKSEKEKLNLSSLKKLKKQYSFFRKKFESENNYIDASKFKISEALTRIKIEKPGRKLLLYLNKWLNLFGESIARPFYWWYCFLLLFTLLYLFYGYSFTELIDGKQVTKHIEYDFEFDFTRLYSTNWSDVKHFFQAIALSLKNIVPIKLESDYYLSIGPKFPVSQNLSMLQKLINIIIVGALITSMRNFFRK